MEFPAVLGVFLKEVYDPRKTKKQPVLTSRLSRGTPWPCCSPTRPTCNNQLSGPPFAQLARFSRSRTVDECFIQMLAWPLCRKLSGIFVVLNLEDFVGDFPGGFFWALLATKMRRKIRRQNPRQNPAARRLKSARNPFCQKPTLTDGAR